MAMIRLTNGTPPWVVAGYSAALVFVFLGERVFSSIAPLREGLSGVGVFAAVALTVLRWRATSAAEGERRSVEQALAILSTLGLVALVLYFTTADPFAAELGITKLATETRNRYEAAVTVAWVVLLLVSVVPMFFAERALFPMRRAAHVEWRRVRDAMTGGLTLGLAAAYGALFCFVAGETDVKADFSYFHTARPSEPTKKIAASINGQLRVVAFFPQLSEVGSEVASYLGDLKKGLPNVEVDVEDRLLVPKLAKEAKVDNDGVILLERGNQRELVTVGTEMATARPKLKTLDADFQKALLKVLREKKNAYFTVGHGELNDAAPSQQNEGRTGKGMREILEQQNYGVRDTSSATGLGVDVPDDATLVVVLGPSQAFVPEEAQSLKRFADRGGKLFLALDPQAKIDLDPLAEIAGVTIGSALLANDRVHMRRRFNDSDRSILATNRFSSHASVSTLSRIGSHPVLFLGAGAVETKNGADPALTIDFAVKAMPDTFDDRNGNFAFDGPPEKRNTFNLVAAVSTKIPPGTPKKRSDEMRAFVLGDADAVSDAALGNDGNVVLVADAVRWLTGEESFAGEMTTAADVRIEHTKQKDLAWFYGSIFGAPAIVLGGGLLYTRRIRRKKPKAPPPSPPPEKENASANENENENENEKEDEA
jgi:hypothetical protein